MGFSRTIARPRPGRPWSHARLGRTADDRLYGPWAPLSPAAVSGPEAGSATHDGSEGSHGHHDGQTNVVAADELEQLRLSPPRAARSSSRRTRHSRGTAARVVVRRHVRRFRPSQPSTQRNSGRSTNPAAWTADGVLFATNEADSSNVWRVPIALATGRIAGAAELLTSDTAVERSPSVSTSGRIVFASTVTNVDVWRVPLDERTGAAAGPPERVTESDGQRPPRERQRGRPTPRVPLVAYRP